MFLIIYPNFIAQSKHELLVVCCQRHYLVAFVFKGLRIIAMSMLDLLVLYTYIR